jgi:Flp pilus assembly protein TadG
MSQNRKSFFRRAYKDQRGQMLPIVAFVMITLLGFAGLVVDVGHAYFSYHLLLNSTNSAAMAGAQGLSLSGTQALSNAKAYSSQSGGQNIYANLNVTGATYTLGCVTAAVGSGIPCVSTGIGGGTANAIQVTQTASVPTTFMKLFGYSSIPLSATGTALWKGAAPKAYNLAVVIDTTGSMGSLDSNCGKNVTRLQCALSGVQVLLQTISPCASGGCGTLGSDGNYTNAVDRVSLFTFPEMQKYSQASYDYDCSASTNATPTPYTYPSATGTTYSPASTDPSYQIMPFMSNYQTLDSSGAPSGSLNTATGSNASNVVLAVGGKSNCAGMNNNNLGGEGTYFAGVIYAARAALLAQQTAESKNGQTVQNAMIILSDGEATASPSQMSSSGLTGTGSYPDTHNECAQAVQAAKDATSAGITVYSVAYGASTKSGDCSTDLSTAKTINGKKVPAGITTPCDAVRAMASDPSTTFYSDTSGTAGCSSPLVPATLGDIFRSIGEQTGRSRLIPNSAFPSS